MKRTKSGLPKYCSLNVDRHGKRRVRFRKAGFSTYLTGTPWSEEFMRQLAQAIDGVKAQSSGGEIGSKRTIPGSFDALAVSYYGSAEFQGLQPNTQSQRRRVIERFRVEHGTKPLKGLQREHIKKILGAKAATPESSNHLLKILRAILFYAVDLEWIAANPAADIKKIKRRTEGHHTWTESEIAQFQNHFPVGSKQRLALALGSFTAQRKGDVLRMGWQHVMGDMIAVRQEKTSTPLMIPLHPELRAVLESVPRTNLTFLTTSRGAPFDPNGFGNWWRAQCDAAGLPHCSFHGLRKAAATRLAEAGCPPHQIAAMTGHKSLAEVARYTKAVDQQRLARQALETQLRAEGERKLSNVDARLDKQAKKA
jgi:integrase